MYSEDKKNQVKVLFEQGNSIRKISQETGIPKSTVADWLNEEDQTESIQELSFTEPKLNFSGQMIEKSDKTIFPDNIRTESDIVFGQNNAEMEKNSDNSGHLQPNCPREIYSHEFFELKKQELLYQHERIMREQDRMDRVIQLKEKEFLAKEQIIKMKTEHKTAMVQIFSRRFNKLINRIVQQGQSSDWTFEEIEDLLDETSDLMEDLIENNNPSIPGCDLTNGISLLTWLESDLRSILADNENAEVIEVEFYDDEWEHLVEANSTNLIDFIF